MYLKGNNNIKVIKPHPPKERRSKLLYMYIIEKV